MKNSPHDHRFLATVTAGLLILAGQLAHAETYDLRDLRQPDDEVTVKITVATQGAVQGATMKAGDEEQVDLTVRSQLAYEERLIATAPTLRSLRQYETAQSQIVIGQHAETNQLDPSRNVIVANTKGNAHLYSPVGALSRQELDVLKVPTCSLACYGLLPGKPVSLGQSWRPSVEALTNVLRLDHVGVNKTAVKLVDVARGLARMQITGTLKGIADGATTDIQLSGDIRYDLRWKHLTWVQLTIQERRDVGPVSVPYVARADVRMLVSPLEGESRLSAIPQEIAQQDAPQAAHLRFASETAGLEILHDRHWHLTEERPQRATFRLIENGKVIAQCNLSRLPALPNGKQLALEEFQSDIQQALGDQFAEFESATKNVRNDGQPALRVTARGIIEGVPIRWIYYHVSNPSGQRAAYVFTLADELQEKFAQRDRLLVDSIRFTAANARTAANNKPTEQR